MNYKSAKILKSACLAGMLALIMLLSEACKRKELDLDKLDFSQWNPDLAVPLANMNLTIADVIGKTNASTVIKIDSATNSCYLIYRGNLFSAFAADFFKLPDFRYSYSYTPSVAEIAVINALPAGSSTFFKATNDIDFKVEPTDVAIDNVTFKDGALKVGITSNVRQNLQVIVSIPGAKFNGAPFSTVLNVSYTGTLPVVAAQDINLKGYKFDLTANGGIKNKLTVNYDIKVTKTANISVLGENLSFYEDLSKLKFSTIVGDLGQQILTSGQDTVPLSLFNNTTDQGSFVLDDPSIQLFISNSYGAPVNINVQQVWAYRKSTNLTYPVILPPAYSGIDVNYPNQNEPGKVKETAIEKLDNKNSNITSVINKLPNSIIYKVLAKTNKLGPAPVSNRNVIVDSSRFIIDFEVRLPFYGTAKDFTITDTTKVDFKDYPQQATKVLIRNYVTNGFPVDVAIQLYLADEKGVIKDSLVRSNNRIIIPSAKDVDSKGRVHTPTSQINDFVFDKDRLAALEKIKKIIIVGRAATINNGTTPVRFYADYNMIVRLGVQATPKVRQ